MLRSINISNCCFKLYKVQGLSTDFTFPSTSQRPSRCPSHPPSVTRSPCAPLFITRAFSTVPRTLPARGGTSMGRLERAVPPQTRTRSGLPPVSRRSSISDAQFKAFWRLQRPGPFSYGERTPMALWALRPALWCGKLWCVFCSFIFVKKTRDTYF
jgi:hypothetical protein